MQLFVSVTICHFVYITFFFSSFRLYFFSSNNSFSGRNFLFLPWLDWMKRFATHYVCCRTVLSVSHNGMCSVSSFISSFFFLSGVSSSFFFLFIQQIYAMCIRKRKRFCIYFTLYFFSFLFCFVSNLLFIFDRMNLNERIEWKTNDSFLNFG